MPIARQRKSSKMGKQLIISPERLSSQLQDNLQEIDAEEEIKYRVLIANDDPSQLFFLKLIFELEKFEVTTAQNG